MHTPPKTPELNAADDIGEPEAIELKDKQQAAEAVNSAKTPENDNAQGNQAQLGSSKDNTSSITGMVGTSDQFSSVSTAESLDDDDNFADALALMKIDASGIIGTIEKIPLPIKLIQLSIFAIIGMLVRVFPH